LRPDSRAQLPVCLCRRLSSTNSSCPSGVTLAAPVLLLSAAARSGSTSWCWPQKPLRLITRTSPWQATCVQQCRGQCATLLCSSAAELSRLCSVSKPTDLPVWLPGSCPAISAAVQAAQTTWQARRSRWLPGGECGGKCSRSRSAAVHCCGSPGPCTSTAQVPQVPSPRQLISAARPLCGVTPASSMAVRSVAPRSACGRAQQLRSATRHVRCLPAAFPIG